MSGFSDKQQHALRRNVTQRHIRTRVSDDKELSYIEGWFAIAEANRIFGFDGWDRETVEARCVQAREVRGSQSVLYAVRVRITVRPGERAVVRDGYGTGEGHGHRLSEAHDLALKAAETDATKRALVTFGRAFGLALYSDRRRRPAGLDARVGRDDGETGALPAAVAKEPIQSSIDVPGAMSTLEHADGAGVSANGGGTGGPLPIGNSRRVSRSQTLRAVSQIARVAARRMEVTQLGGRVDKSQLLLSEPRRIRDKDHLRYVASQPCAVCSRVPADAHHIRFAQPKAFGTRASDEFTVPLCRAHHRELHGVGDERAWWHDMGLDPLPIARRLWQESCAGNEVDAGGGKNGGSAEPAMAVQPEAGPETEVTEVGHNRRQE